MGIDVGKHLIEHAILKLDAFLKLDGSNANQNIDIGTFDFTCTDLVCDTINIATGDVDISTGDLSFSTSDSGIFWAGTNVRSGIFTEVNGDLLSFGINVPQADVYDNTLPGIIYRLDSRSNGSFTIIGYKANDSNKFYIIQQSNVGLSTQFNHYNTTTTRKAAEFGLSGWGGIFYNSTGGNECDLSGADVAIQAKGDIHLYNDSDELDFGTGKDWRLYSDGTDFFIDRLVGAGNIKISDDSVKLLFGTGFDASITYDGTNLIINTQEVGTGNLTIVGGSGVLDSDEGVYLGGVAVDGSWRIIRSGNDLVFERRESSVWVEKGAFTA